MEQLKSFSQNKSQVMLPINIVTIYLLITVALFLWGPVEYQYHYKFLDFLYLTFAVLMLRFGYIRGVTTSKLLVTFKDQTTDVYDKRRTNKSFLILLILYIAIVVLTLLSRTGNAGINWTSFSNLGQAYYSRGQSNLLYERLIYLTAPITTAFIPYGMIKMKSLKRLYKCLFFIAVLFRVLVDISQGINKTLADAIIFLLIFTLANLAKSSFYYDNSSSIFKRRLVTVGIVFGFLLGAFVLFFSANLLSRTIGDANGYKNGWMYLASYFSEGYQAVDYSLTQPFESTFGVGNSLYLFEAIRRFFNTDFFLMRSYLYKNQLVYGWSYMVSWSSFYVWIANDVSMLGVFPVLFIVGKIFGKTWNRTICGQNDLSDLIVLGLMFQLAMYIPANNQIVQIQSAFVGTWFWIIYWALHKKVKIKWRRR